MTTIEILQKLISIPSWVDKTTNEQEIGEWIYKFLKSKSKLKILKQPIGQGRFNILAQKGRKVDTLVTGHIDTVQPNSNWNQSPTNPRVVGDKLYGRGSSDMKNGIAIILYLCTLPNLKDGIAFLFYCDEEYDFLGMKKFIQEYKTKINPKLIVSLDGEGLAVGNSCRGLIEMKVLVQGKAGHAAKPRSGINAITESFKVINKLKGWAFGFKSKELGNSTLNIAYMNGGGSEGNVIAEKCEYIVEIRVANEKLNANLVQNFIIENSEKLGLKVASIKIRHDIGSWITTKKELEDIIPLAPIKKVKSAKTSGYIDIQMLWQAFGRVPTFSLSAGEPGQSHKANEYVKISNVLKAQKFYEKILTK
ncbi:MAG: M20/M25/M40 family metallo-hydrolase [Candidatus Woesebacteria bacterium]|nr:MAG: M20/M25/M40 family metallo-hydrolase [Candidatus Woesebacteria bacterium]